MQTHSQNKDLAAQWLEAEFLRRKSGNASYSLRAYAKFLGIPPGRLSEILSGKRKLSRNLSAQTAEKLGLSPTQRELFQKGFGAKNKRKARDESYALIEEDTFATIAEWAHTAVLSLFDTEGFRADPAWISRRLALSPVECRAILSRLARLGLVTTKGNKIQKTNTNLRTPDGIPSAALRKSHRDSILQAVDALDEIPVDERDITSMSMAIDPAKLPLAKKLIRDFRYSLAELLESGSRQEVYNLNVQLVPVTKKEK